MQWNRLNLPTANARCQQSKQEGFPIVADIRVYYKLSCPVCQRVFRVEDQIIDSPAPGHSSEARRYLWQVNLESQLKQIVERRRTLATNCPECGTSGVLVAADASALLAALQKQVTRRDLDTALMELGFEVHSATGYYEFVGNMPRSPVPIGA